MKVVILAGGFGTRISEESHLKPKPMIEIGGMPILWHIMKSYSQFGHHEFIICLGYKGYLIKEFFSNYYLHSSDVTFDLRNQNQMTIHNHTAEPWMVTLVETGQNTMTGGRLKRVARYLSKDEPFMLTYGDGVSDIDIDQLMNFHRSNGKLGTVTAIQTIGRFGALTLDDSTTEVQGFVEKPKHDGSWINGGFFIFQPEFLDYIEGDDTVLEKAPLEKLAKDGQLAAYKHTGFWQCMDTLRDKQYLEELVHKNQAPWATWNGLAIQQKSQPQPQIARPDEAKGLQ
jgi:glucose-1-phosphate cytidylyltransferase